MRVSHSSSCSNVVSASPTTPLAISISAYSLRKLGTGGNTTACTRRNLSAASKPEAQAAQEEEGEEEEKEEGEEEEEEEEE